MTDQEVLAIAPDAIGKNTAINVEVLGTHVDLYYDIALTMADAIIKNNRENKNSCFIVPVGPVFQYRRFSRLCKRYDIDLKNAYFFFMDEYLTNDGKLIDIDNPLSFRGFIEREFFGTMEPRERLLKENVIFPDTDNIEHYSQRIQELGGIDICIGGVGIRGHIAFNEPPEIGQTADPDEFKNSPTRILKLNLETRAINANTATRGNIYGVPKTAITVGMKDILASREIRLYLERDWQPAVMRRMIYGPVTPDVPASFIQQHPNVHVIMTPNVLESPIPALR